MRGIERLHVAPYAPVLRPYLASHRSSHRQPL